MKWAHEIFVSRRMGFNVLGRPSFQDAFEPALNTLSGVKSSLVDRRF